MIKWGEANLDMRVDRQPNQFWDVAFNTVRKEKKVILAEPFTFFRNVTGVMLPPFTNAGLYPEYYHQSSLWQTYPRVVVVSLVHLVLVSVVGVGELVGLHRPGAHPHHGLAAPLLLGQRVRLVLPTRVPHHFAEVDIFPEIVVLPSDPHAKI